MKIDLSLPFAKSNVVVECLDQGNLAFRSAAAQHLARTLTTYVRSGLDQVLQEFETDFVSHLLNCTDTVENDHDEVLSVQCEVADAAKQVLDTAVSCFEQTLNRASGTARDFESAMSGDEEKEVCDA